MSTSDELTALYERIHACRQCLHVEPSPCARKVVPQACHAQLALMAQAPSKEGVRKSGMHWVGANREVRRPGGTFLDKYLRTVGYSVDPADMQRPRPYTTNALQCWTRGSGKGDRTPSKDELGRCKRWWVAELQIVRPAVLVLLGKVALKAFADLCDIDTREQGVPVTLGDVSVRRFILPHPSDRRDNSDLYDEVFCQIGEVLGGLIGGPTRPCS